MRSKILLTLLVYFTLHVSAYTQNYSYFESFDSTTIAYQDIGKGQPVFLIHGFISNGTSWNGTELFKQLQANGYRLIIPDLRGNGKSDKPHDPARYANDAEIKDLTALADHLKIEDFQAIGYSRGSIVLAKLLTQEDRITKAVIGGMGIDFTNPGWDRRIRFAEAFGGQAPLNEMTSGAVNYAKSINADLEVLSLLQWHQPVTSIEELNAMNTPVMVIAGDEDTDNGNPNPLHQELPNSQLTIIPGDHNNTYKTKRFAQEVISYLSAK